MNLPEIKLTDNEAAFVRAYAQGNTVAAATNFAGLGEKAGYGLLQRPRVVAAILIDVRRQLALAAPMSLRILKELALNARDEKVRRDCATRILDRAGLVAPRAPAADLSDNAQLNEMSIDQLHKLAEQLEIERARRAKTVESTPVARIDQAQPSYVIDITE